jgi:flavin reductase (DIM6/NTAB) family NADH-FMN oxidoreductase RutF
MNINMKTNQMDLLHLTQSYRQTIGLFATGVTVLIIEQDGEVYCMTANAVSSLSLEPIQLLACPAKTASFSKFIKKNVFFTVNILSIEQEQVSNYYAGKKQNEAIAKGEYDYLFSKAIKVPRLTHCMASFACQIKQIHDGGDHWIVVGEVHELYQNKEEKQPLLYFNGKYHYPSVNEQKLLTSKLADSKKSVSPVGKNLNTGAYRV